MMRKIKNLNIVFAIFLFIGCGDDQTQGPLPDLFSPRIDTSSDPCAGCNGCCLNGTACVAGNSIVACGLGGVPCKTCDATSELCVSGICQEQTTQTCSALNCSDGCCDSSGNCQRPSNDAHCGLSGSTCKECKAGETSCENGVCEKTAPTQYNIKVVSADLSGCDCGFNDSDCDGYVEVTFMGTEYSSDPVSDNNAPQWNQFLFQAADTDLLANPISIIVKDSDITFDSTLGVCEIQVDQQDLNAQTKKVECVNDDDTVKDLTFAFEVSGS